MHPGRPTTDHRDRRHNRRERAAHFWRSCLWLSLWVWSAPVPWLHSHDILRAVGAESWLTQHLAAYHHGGDGAAAPSGWHMHVLFACGCGGKPTDETPGTPDDSPTDNGPPTLRITEPTDVRQSLRDEHRIVGTLPLDGLAVPPVIEHGASSTGDFLRTYFRGARPSQILSLWRC